MDISTYLPSDWELAIPSKGRLIVKAGSQQDADRNLEQIHEKLIASATRLQAIIEVSWDGCSRPYRLSSELNKLCEKGKPKKKKQLPSLAVSINEVAEYATIDNADAQMASLAHKEENHAAWIIDQDTQEVLLANRAALAANHKPPREILMENISSLWEEDALRKLTNLVNQDKLVNDHSNIGYRWQKDGSIWVRAKHEFHVDYHLINYLGRPARFEIVKAANFL
jgi:PAS domain-containing protein